MNRKKRSLAIVSVFFVLLGLLFWRVYRQYEQERKDQALITAIKAEDTPRALELLAEGADGNSRDTGEAPSFGQVLRRFLNRLRHPGSSPVRQPDTEEHLTALLLLYHRYEPVLAGRNERPGPELSLIRALLEHHAQVNDRDVAGRSPLWWACRFSGVDAVRLLLERRADTEAAGPLGQKPIIEACENPEATRVLLEHGARIEATDDCKRTTLMYAAMLNHTDVVQLLLQHGAKVSSGDANGETALDHIKNRSDPESRKIAALLRQYGAK